MGKAYNLCKFTITSGLEPGQDLYRLTRGLEMSKQIFLDFITAKENLVTTLITEDKPGKSAAVARFLFTENMVHHELKDMVKQHERIQGASQNSPAYKFKLGLDSLLEGLSQVGWVTPQEHRLIMEENGIHPSHTPTRPIRTAPPTLID